MDKVTIDKRRENIFVADGLASYVAGYISDVAKQHIQEKGSFTLALSGGSTPRDIIYNLSSMYLEWDKIYIFWSDERDVPLEHEDSNYKMAMDAGLSKIETNIFRIETEKEDTVERYEEILKKYHPLDLVMLGVGKDGHTASLFPDTSALKENSRLFVSNNVPQNGNRYTFTLKAINEAAKAVLIATGSSKRDAWQAAFYNQNVASFVGTSARPALWIPDQIFNF